MAFVNGVVFAPAAVSAKSARCRHGRVFTSVAPWGPGGKPPKSGDVWRRRRRDDGGDGSGDGVLGLLASLWKDYSRLLDSSPLLTKAVTAAVLAFIGDLLAQAFESGGEKWSDLRRMFSMAMTSAIVTAPMFHTLYHILEMHFPATGFRNIGIQLAIDQLLAAPLFVPVFFLVAGLFEGKTLKDITDQLRRDCWPMIKLTWCVYPFVQAVNFTFVPLELRTLTVSVVDLAFMVVLSYISHLSEEPAHQFAK